MSAFTVCITYPVLLMHEMQYIHPAIKWCLDKDTLHHVSSLCQSINVQLRNLRRIKRYLDKDTLHHVVRVLVLSRIDYGNLLLFGSTSYELDRVQRLQNSAAPLICSTPLREYIYPITLGNFIGERIHYKIALLVFKCFNKATPHYITTLLSHYTPPRFLRSTLDITRFVWLFPGFQCGWVHDLEQSPNCHWGI